MTHAAPSTASVRVGMVSEATQVVTPDTTAQHLGSGSLKVYATPAMVAFFEHTCQTMVEPLLPEGRTTVGMQVQMRHLAATPLGEVVRIRAEVVAVSGNVIDFRGQVWDRHELVGEGEHRRVVIERDRFLKRVRSKLPQGDGG